MARSCLINFLHHLSIIVISTVLLVYRCSYWHNVFNFIIRSHNLTTALCRIHVQSKSRYSLYITTVPRRITLIYVYIILSAHYMVTITYIRFQRITIHTHFSYSSYLYILSFVHNHIKLPHLHIHLTFILPLSTYTIRQNLMERISMTNKPKDKHLDIVKDSSSDKIATVVDFWDPLGNPTQPTPRHAHILRFVADVTSTSTLLFCTPTLYRIDIPSHRSTHISRSFLSKTAS